MQSVHMYKVESGKFTMYSQWKRAFLSVSNPVNCIKHSDATVRFKKIKKGIFPADGTEEIFQEERCSYKTKLWSIVIFNNVLYKYINIFVRFIMIFLPNDDEKI